VKRVKVRGGVRHSEARESKLARLDAEGFVGRPCLVQASEDSPPQSSIWARSPDRLSPDELNNLFDALDQIDCCYHV